MNNCMMIFIQGTAKSEDREVRIRGVKTQEQIKRTPTRQMKQPDKGGANEAKQIVMSSRRARNHQQMAAGD